jgi:hypothetical protein
MLSLPEIDDLPPVEDVKPSSERKSKKELKAERTSASKIAREAIAVETSASISGSMSPAPAVKADIATPIIGARFQQKQKSGKGGLYAMIGVGLAAAAGVGWYVSTQMKSSASSEQVASVSQDRAEDKVRAQSAPVAAPAAGSATVTAIAEPTAPPPAEPKADEAVATGMGGATAANLEDAKVADEGAKRGNTKSVAAKHDKKKEEIAKPAPVEKKPDPKDVTKGDGKKKDGEAGEGEPSFDALLKEAGVQDKKPVKVALEKKSLSGADFKKGMGAVAGKAQACYAGTQGTAQLKLTVSPEGAVQKVAVTGVFAGTPVAKCVENAVKGATFPAWDGGPQSFGYSYLLAE